MPERPAGSGPDAASGVSAGSPPRGAPARARRLLRAAVVAAGTCVVAAALFVPGSSQAVGRARATPDVRVTRHVVEMRGFAFVPDRIEVMVGDTVVWKNMDAVPHTATDSAGVWDSGLVAGEGEWAWVASGPGRWRYICTYHPTMRGVVTVKSKVEES